MADRTQEVTGFIFNRSYKAGLFPRIAEVQLEHLPSRDKAEAKNNVQIFQISSSNNRNGDPRSHCIRPSNGHCRVYPHEGPA